jgi:type I restriction enzyme M protein
LCKIDLNALKLQGDEVPQGFDSGQAFNGFDNDANMVKIAILNLYLHQLERAKIEHFNPLTTGFGGAYPGKMFEIILANPPFSGKVQDESILADLNYKLDTRATELLFLKWFIDHLAPGGRAGVIVPNGVLFGSTNAATKLRELPLTIRFFVRIEAAMAIILHSLAH